MKHIVNLSGGLCSFWALKRVVDAHGPNDVVPLFADVLIEDRDLYEFNRATEALLGVKIVRTSRELTPWELFRKKGIIGNPRHPICSIILKREILDEWHRANALEFDTIIYVGFDATEYTRLEDLRRAHPTWRIEAPMCEPPLWDKCRIIEETKRLGLKIPRAYELGFPHNNCGMRCVRAGITHWVHLLNVLPESYDEWEKDELLTMDVLRQRGIEPMTILRDRRGGVTKAMTLKELRERVEAGEQFSKLDWGGCGCGGAI